MDASMALTWLVPEEVTAATDAIMDRLDQEVAVVPGLWFIEMANIASTAERNGRITQAETELFLSRLARPRIDVDQQAPGRAFSHILPLCRAHGLTSYDAVYIELALRRGLPLATLDAAMSAVGHRLGLELLV